VFDLLASPQPLKNVCSRVSAICRNDKSNVLANGFFSRVADHSFSGLIPTSDNAILCHLDPCLASSEESTIAASKLLVCSASSRRYAADYAAKASSRMLKKCSVATRYVLRFGRWRFQESLLEGPEDEQAD
jgi:hypothetical protein